MPSLGYRTGLVAVRTRVLMGPEPIELYRQMLQIRLVEDEVYRQLLQGNVRGTTHLCQGQEAVPVGVCSVIRPTDWVTCTYRGHGWALARGVDLEAFFAELMGRASGLCSGKGGSMHLTDLDRGLFLSSGIVGGAMPPALGVAYAHQLRGDDGVAVTSFGDGATNIGTFHESLNMAAVWRLPVVFVCENNLYGEYTPAGETALVEDLADRACAYGIPGHVVDGNDVEAVRELALEAVERARRGDGPTLIEAKTYRHGGHSRTDPAKYRPDDEVERWKARDPLIIAEQRLLEREGVDQATLDAAREQTLEQIRDALTAAKEAPEAGGDVLLTDVYVDDARSRS
jgi:TPP-dependent pyruvate/acetoin dehydrogenase alpha subunit